MAMDFTRLLEKNIMIPIKEIRFNSIINHVIIIDEEK